MVTVKRLGVWSVAKVEALIMLVFGLVLTIISAVGGVVAGNFLPLMFKSAPMMATGQNGFLAGLTSGLAVTVIWTIFGFIGGGIAALVFNLVSRWVGGIRLELSAEERGK